MARSDAARVEGTHAWSDWVSSVMFAPAVRYAAWACAFLRAVLADLSFPSGRVFLYDDRGRRREVENARCAATAAFGRIASRCVNGVAQRLPRRRFCRAAAV